MESVARGRKTHQSLLRAPHLSQPAFLLLSAEAVKTFEVVKGSHNTDTYWQSKCKSKGGRLASINNAVEQAAAQTALNGAGHVPPGMKRAAPHKHFINGDDDKLMCS